MQRFCITLLCVLNTYFAQAEDGYKLWLRYEPVLNQQLSSQYKEITKAIYFGDGDPTLDVAKAEVQNGLPKLLSIPVSISKDINKASLVICTIDKLPASIKNQLTSNLEDQPNGSYIIKTIGKQLVVVAPKSIGVLYGTFHLLRLMQSDESINNLNIIESPKIDLRLLNHWDNLDRTVERGYAGFSLWNWHKLPEVIDQRYIDYARANASIGINGTVLTNVNANALVLTAPYIKKTKAIADAFRPYGLKVYLTARFSAPMEIGGLDTADPLNKDVAAWWEEKAKEIYKEIPDFGGFLVKANSEGQPGPQNFGRTHADGANMLAKALKPFNGVVIWRAFVYSEHDPADRAKQAYSEFVPFDGQFAENVLIQVKNGAIDFQPREPFHPMFGAMPQTPLMMEFQITQEYLGFSTHLVFLPKLFEETLQADTHRKGPNSTVAKVIDGSLHSKRISGIAGVSNIGTNINWTGHPFAQANWYGFGRLAWDPNMGSKEIAKEWLKATFSSDPDFVNPMSELLISSRETVVKYMTPLGLHHIMDANHHYGPGPWIKNMPRPDWTSVYYHKADKEGIGFNRSSTGSNATAQYAPELAKVFNDPKATPSELLLWFHHLPWSYKLENDRTLWDNIGITYQEGVNEVREMTTTWEQMSPFVDHERHQLVKSLLSIQLNEAIWWKNACMSYFKQFSELPFPAEMEKPDKSLEYYMSLKFPFAPGIKPKWD
ncbi:alpha-glucuronidase [Fulvivirga lutimaris]|nr:alpha-glucuronidase family glycosyl hydrolase [Fulvivirga lutimaris]MTI40587.1 alpha-glucuronidase [Fulvivirga lutimaris]